MESSSTCGLVHRVCLVHVLLCTVAVIIQFPERAIASESTHTTGQPSTQPSLRLDLQSALNEANRPEVGEHMWGWHKTQMLGREARIVALAASSTKTRQDAVRCLAVDMLRVRWTARPEHSLTIIRPRGKTVARPDEQSDQAIVVSEEQWRYLSPVAEAVSTSRPPAVLTEEVHWVVIVTYCDGVQWRRTTWINMQEDLKGRDHEPFARLMTLTNLIDEHAPPPDTLPHEKVIDEYEALPTAVPPRP